MNWLKKNLEESLLLPPDAVEWLMMLFNATQFFDDIADHDPVTREMLDVTLWNVLIAMPQNEFFLRNSFVLLPVMANSILKWQASDIVERSGKADERSFVWRASYYDVVLSVLNICHGPEVAIKNSDKAMCLYGEDFRDYIKEFRNG
jgi:hypothetical protein